MKKSELIDAVAEKSGESKAAAARVVEALQEVIVEGVEKGERIALPGFGTFKSGERAARTGRNPQTGDAIEIKAARTVGFTASEAFKSRVKNTPLKKKK